METRLADCSKIYTALAMAGRESDVIQEQERQQSPSPRSKRWRIELLFQCPVSFTATSAFAAFPG